MGKSRSKLQNEGATAALIELELQRRLQAWVTLTTAALALNATLDPETTLEAALSAVRQVTDCQQAALFDLDATGEALTLRLAYGLDPDRLRRAQHLTLEPHRRQALTQGWSIAIGDLEAEADVPSWLEAVLPAGCRAVVSLPLVVPQQAMGCLVAFFSEPHLWTDFDRTLWRILADQAAVTISNARLRAGLLHERDLVHVVAGGMSEGLVVADLQGQVVMVNQAARQMLGIEVGQRWEFQPSISERARRAEALLATPGPWLILEKKDRLMNVSIMRLPGGQASDLATVYVVRDITRWVELDELKTDFISQVSHELRTPLATIKTLVGLLKKERVPQEAAREFLAIIESEVDRQTQLVNDLLEVGRLESGEVSWTVVEIVPTEVAEKAIRACLPLASEKGVSLVGSPLPILPRVMGTPRRLQEALTNLLVNAVKYTPAGGLVSVTAGCDDQVVWLAVRDTGPGIAETDLPHIFEKFYRARQTRGNHQGVGLGLTIAWQVVRAMHGTIEVQSQVGEGSCFTVRLPRARTFVAAMRETFEGAQDECADPVDR
ncbi:MAG: ATP-binding protein [Chloroflexota bacterium]